VSFIEPFWGGGYGLPGGDDFVGLQGNDYHPPAWVGPAEHDLLQLYTAIRNSPYWSELLFIVTFDEHGGTWDHEPMTATVAPDDSPSRLPFGFERLGVRVPTILVTPFVRPGTVFRAPTGSPYDFDHTSFIATLLRWAGVDPATAGLGRRTAVAPTFDTVLSDTPFDHAPVISVPDDYRDQGGRKGVHLPFRVRPDPDSNVPSNRRRRHLRRRLPQPTAFRNEPRIGGDGIGDQ
jgi:phospholipase C